MSPLVSFLFEAFLVIKICLAKFPYVRSTVILILEDKIKIATNPNNNQLK